MQIDVSPDEVTALMLRLPIEAQGLASGFVYAEPLLMIPDEWADAAAAIMAGEGWREAPDVPPPTSVAKLVAFLAANPDVASLISSA